MLSTCSDAAAHGCRARPRVTAVTGKARLGARVYKKTATAVCSTEVNKEDSHKLEQIVSNCKLMYSVDDRKRTRRPRSSSSPTMSTPLSWLSGSLPSVAGELLVPYCFDGAASVKMGERLWHLTQTGICEQNNKHKCHTDHKGV
jgi:hypothetical protein